MKDYLSYHGITTISTLIYNFNSNLPILQSHSLILTTLKYEKDIKVKYIKAYSRSLEAFSKNESS